MHMCTHMHKYSTHSSKAANENRSKSKSQKAQWVSQGSLKAEGTLRETRRKCVTTQASVERTCTKDTGQSLTLWCSRKRRLTWATDGFYGWGTHSGITLSAAAGTQNPSCQSWLLLCFLCWGLNSGPWTQWWKQEIEISQETQDHKSIRSINVLAGGQDARKAFWSQVPVKIPPTFPGNCMCVVETETIPGYTGMGQVDQWAHSLPRSQVSTQFLSEVL